ncbi:Rv1476 family membrane protein [Nocardia jiangxiensis]|uniref:Rv1476 family membrane protein n=1 Tax=Nocardia jiangxiensis TaxID=282685 RepID=UPI001FE11AE3|nr:DUF6676 family protein [Nocardia jiangxiensis]
MLEASRPGWRLDETGWKMTVTFASVGTPRAAEIPPEVDVHTILAQLAADHVSVPEGDDPSDLESVVADTRDQGIPLSVVVVPGNPSPDSSLRDLATVVGKSEHGTVLVLSDDWAGTYSDTYSRYRLEKAEDIAKNRHGGHSVEATRAFVQSLETNGLISWPVFTYVLLLGVLVVTGGLYLVKRRRSRVVPEHAAADPVH